MILHITCIIYVVIANTLVTRSTGSDRAIDNSEDDDEKLQQALVLVQLLKSEYAMAIRRNNELLNQQTRTGQDFTSAATNYLDPTTTHSSITKQLEAATVNDRKPRRMAGYNPPHTTYSKQGFSRQIDDVQLKTVKTASGRASKTTSVSRALKGVTVKVPTVTKSEDTTLNNKNISSTGEIETLTKEDPVLSQVASELINELQDRETKKTKHILRANPETTTKFKKNSNIYKFRNIVKPTFKIHLDSSTRLPIPLPENNAFCYTNPKNALCRTYIK